jgi:hypothetical protein
LNMSDVERRDRGRLNDAANMYAHLNGMTPGVPLDVLEDMMRGVAIFQGAGVVNQAAVVAGDFVATTAAECIRRLEVREAEAVSPRISEVVNAFKDGAVQRVRATMQGGY